MTKTEFVQQQSADLSLHEVIRNARRKGMTVSPATVYAARQHNKPAMTKSAICPHSWDSSSLELQFLVTAAELGRVRAQELLDQLPLILES